VAVMRRRTGGMSLGEACASTGFRRVELVRVVVCGTSVEANATGVLHRYPRTVQISLAAATRLAAAGAPLAIERCTTRHEEKS
jgi:hypothetical protein